MTTPTQQGWTGQQCGWSGQPQSQQQGQQNWAGQAQQNGQPAAAPASSAPSAADLLMGQSRKGRSASFRQVGAVFAGTICGAPEVTQQRDPQTGDPKFYQGSTDPIWQIVLPCQTEYRDPTNVGPDDDGVRYLYIGGPKKPESLSMHVAVAQAVRSAGAKELQVGGYIEVMYTGDGPKSPNAPAVAQPPKQYQARYTLPPSQASQMLGLGGQDQQAGQQPPVQSPAPQQSVWDQGQQQGQQQSQAAPQGQGGWPNQQQVAQAPAAGQPDQQQTPPSGQQSGPRPVNDQTGADPELVKAIAHLPVEQQNALIAGGVTLDQVKAMGWIS